jgi:hypothetical protein
MNCVATLLREVISPEMISLWDRVGDEVMMYTRTSSHDLVILFFVNANE